jgi:hypothetical protein
MIEFDTHFSLPRKVEYRTTCAENPMFSDAQWNWLLFEGVIPLFGAGFLYLAWGGVRRITAMSWSTSSYAWKESIDSMGWLYGALIIVIQTAIKSANATPPSSYLKWGCIIGGVLCALLLLSAMNERGQNALWRPPMLMKLVATLLVIGILSAGFVAQGLKQNGHSTPSLSPGADHER